MADAYKLILHSSVGAGGLYGTMDRSHPSASRATRRKARGKDASRRRARRVLAALDCGDL